MSAEDSATGPEGGTPARQHEGPLKRAEEWFRGHEPEIRAAAKAGDAGAEELKPVLQDHFARIFALAAKVLAHPELKAVAPEVLELAETAARIGSAAL